MPGGEEVGLLWVFGSLGLLGRVIMVFRAQAFCSRCNRAGRARTAGQLWVFTLENPENIPKLLQTFKDHHFYRVGKSRRPKPCQVDQ